MMEFSITPYAGDSPMRPWPALAEKAFCLKGDFLPAEGLFFFDSPPSGCRANSGAEAPPAFVLIHGLGDEADTWRHLIPLLNSRGYRVLAPDLPGFGRSVASGKFTLKSYANAVLSLIEAAVRPLAPFDGRPDENARPGRPAVFLAGSSMGALVVEEAAIRKPEFARGIVLIDGSIPGGPQNPGLFALAKLLFRRKWYRAYRDDAEGAWASLRPYYADLDSLPPADKEFLRQRVAARVESCAQERAFFAVQRSLVRTYMTCSSRFARKIRQYNGKILLLWGEADRIIPLSSAKAFQSLRGDIGLEIISGAGHLPHQEKPAETARLMVDFAERW